MIQYYHNRVYHFTEYFAEVGGLSVDRAKAKGGKTIALEVFEPWLFDQLVVGDFLEKRVGIARCSYDDNYNKKIGRELAASRLKLRKLTVMQKMNDLLVLLDEYGNYYVLRKTKSGKLFFIECDGEL